MELVTHALYGAAAFSLYGGFGEGALVAALAAVLVDLERPSVGFLHSPVALFLPLALWRVGAGLAVPVAVGMGSHLLLDLVGGDGVSLPLLGRFPSRPFRERLPGEGSPWANGVVSVMSLGALLWVVL